MMQKLKEKQFNLNETENTEKQEIIRKLREEISSMEEQLGEKEREEDDRKDEIYRLKMQVQNYQQEIASLQQNNFSHNQGVGGMDQEQISELKMRFQELQAKNIQEKEKIINFEVELGQKNIEIQNLKI
jgi:chromosome segregation ATPase